MIILTLITDNLNNTGIIIQMFNQYVAFGWKWHGPRKHTKKIKIEILIASRLKRRNIKSTSKY